MVLVAFSDFFAQQKWSILVFVVCLVIQLFLYLRTRQSIQRCRTLFPKRGACTTQESETGTISIGVLSNEERSPEFQEIIKETNDYLEKNQNNISLEALKDIATRISDNAFALSTSKISFPMYYGLMGTYAGVALGLFEFYSSTGGGTSLWTLSQYRDQVQEAENAADAWDELEKSVVAKLADEVGIGIRGKCVEMTIHKKF